MMLLIVTLYLAFLAGTLTAFQPIPAARTAATTSRVDTVYVSTAVDTLRVRNRRDQQMNGSRLSFGLDRTSLRMAVSEEGGAKIIIAGAPASGKGTQCEVIKQKFGVVHLSTGDMLRAAVAAGTDVGRKAKDFMDSGKLVPDEVIIGIVKDRLAEEDCQSNGWLLDGFPRTVAQAKALEDAGVKADCFIFLNVPDDVLVERVVGRRTDPETGKIYHLTFSPPEDDEVRARLEQRSDDTEEKVKVRLEQFHANVEAVKDSYTDISINIDGNRALLRCQTISLQASRQRLRAKNI